MKQTILILLLLTATMTFASESTLWCDKPAEEWETEALPLGNGRLGAMTFGGIVRRQRDRNLKLGICPFIVDQEGCEGQALRHHGKRQRVNKGIETLCTGTSGGKSR
jgi:hypothetical protein